MNTPLLTTRIVLIISFFFTQQTCGMELISYGKRLLNKCFYRERLQNKPLVQNQQFERFAQLLPEIQLLIFKYSDDKVNFQKIDHYWYQTGSIKSPEFINEFNGIGNQRMCRIFLNAIYTKNYDGVENILKHYYAQRPDRVYYYFVDMDRKGKEIVLEPYEIPGIDRKMKELLQKYKMEEAKRSACPSPLMMACLSGSSDFIKSFMQDSKDNIRRALNIVISCDYGQCMQQLLNNINKSDAFEELFFRDENRVFLKRELFRRVCKYKSYKVLKIILQDDRICRKDEIVDDKTILDEVLKLVEDDSNFAPVIKLLKECGVKTAQELAKIADNEDKLGIIGHPFS